MTDKRIDTYKVVHGGESSQQRNWFFANRIDAIETQGINDSPGGSMRIFRRIDERKFATDIPVFNHGRTKAQKNNIYNGCKWTMATSAAEVMIDADRAVKEMTRPVRSQVDGWTKDDKGFLVDYFGWHNANANWWQKCAFEVYNDTSNRLSLPVKGISFTARFPHEDNFFAINDATNINNSKKSRSDQLAINRVYGLWYRPENDRYYVYQMTPLGSFHAPSPHPDNKDFYYYDYWHADSSQSEKGNVSHMSKQDYKIKMSIWANEKVLHECQFCGFAMQFVVDHASAESAPHTMQIGSLSPIPFHIHKSSDFRAVYGGQTSGDDGDIGNRPIYTS